MVFPVTQGNLAKLVLRPVANVTWAGSTPIERMSLKSGDQFTVDRSLDSLYRFNVAECRVHGA